MLPLGIASIAAYAESHGISVDAYDFGAATEAATELLSQFTDLTTAAVVGLSFYNTNALRAFEFARSLKRVNPSQIIVAGGAHPTSCARQVLEACHEIDAVVRGEGEQAFFEIVRNFTSANRRAAFEGVAGVVWRDRNQILDNVGSTKVYDLDSLPAPLLNFKARPNLPLTFYDSTDGRRRRAVAMTTSRSCPYNCSFCAIILIGREWRKASVEKVLADYEELDSKYGPFEHVYFMDANFFVNANRAVEIARGLSRTSSKPTFSFSTRVNQVVRSPTQIRELRALGLRAIELGVESASASALKRFAKDTTPQQNDAALVFLEELGIQLIFDFIMFDAEMSTGELVENVEFLENHALDAYVPWDHLLSWLTPYHGTPIRAHYENDLRLELPIHTLPKPEQLIRDPSVLRVFVEMARFSEYFDALKTAIIRADRCASEHEFSTEIGARAALDSASFRRLPFRVLRNLVNAAACGHNIDLSEAIPFLAADDGSALELQRVLNEVALN